MPYGVETVRERAGGDAMTRKRHRDREPCGIGEHESRRDRGDRERGDRMRVEGLEQLDARRDERRRVALVAACELPGPAAPGARREPPEAGEDGKPGP